MATSKKNTKAQYLTERGLKDGHDHGDFDNISPNQAREILHKKSLNGKPLTPGQYKLFGFLSEGNTKKYLNGGTAANGLSLQDPGTRYLQNYLKQQGQMDFPAYDPNAPIRQEDVPADAWTALKTQPKPLSANWMDAGVLQMPQGHNEKLFGNNEQLAPFSSPEKSRTPWGNYLAPALGAIDSLIPGQKPKSNIVKPLETYSEHPYGTGSQAIFKYGGSLDGGDNPTVPLPPKPPKRALNGLDLGDDPAKKTPAKKYRSLDPQQMTEWNGYLDYVKSKGYEGSKDLDAKDKGLGQKLFSEYSSQNPNLHLDYSWVPDVQNAYLQNNQSAQEFNRRKGGKGDGLQPLENISSPDGWFGHKTSQQRFVPMFAQNNSNGNITTQNLGLVDANLKATGAAITLGAQPGVTGNQKRKYSVNDSDVLHTPEGLYLAPDGTVIGRDAGVETPKMKDGGILPYYQPGSSHDLSPSEIKALLHAGYQIDFE